MDTKVFQQVFADKYYITGQKYPYPCILMTEYFVPSSQVQKRADVVTGETDYLVKFVVQNTHGIAQIPK